jgi:xanthine/CO dehydrogenase XdhC/CoxF family maturation factor
MLIAQGGDYQGLVSGGCLEGDLAAHAAGVITTGEPRIVSYDLRGEIDEVFGLGSGCQGMLRILLQRVGHEADYEPMQTLASALEGTRAGRVAVQIAGASLGATRLWMDGHDAGADPIAAACPTRLPARVSHQGAEWLFARLRPVPRLLVLGAGLDAVPLVAMAAELGWRVTVMDHRPAYLARGDLHAAEQSIEAPVSTLSARVTLDDYAAVVVMSHHLASDREYLRALASSRIPYIGLLGPPGRRAALLSDLGATAAGLAYRLHGPAGLALGADGPGGIALSILAQIELLRSAEPA